MFGQFNRPRWNGERHLNSRMGRIEDSIKMTGLLLEAHNIMPPAGTLSAFPALPALSAFWYPLHPCRFEPFFG